MKTIHQLHNEEQAEAFRRDSVELKLLLVEMEQEDRRLEMLSTVLKWLCIALSVGLVVYMWYQFTHPPV